MGKKRVLMMGAAGRDFHDFNLVYREDDTVEVVGFTAAQIPDIAGRAYPAQLAGDLYPDGIEIYEEEELENLVREKDIDEVVFSYSDVSHEHVMHRASAAIAAGANFTLLGADSTMLSSEKPVVAVTAVRTGVGKSQTTRRVAEILRQMGHEVVTIRHPMPYGDLAQQAVQRFADYEDLDKHKCTIEEREEYEPHIDRDIVVYAGVDYETILHEAEREADVILWDGGNNDLPFYRPTVHIVLADPLRAGHEEKYHPGEANIRLADSVIINKIDTSSSDGIELVRKNVRRLNPDATVVEAASPVYVDDPDLIKDKRVLVVEDGPTLTHGNMAYGAGIVAARKYGAREFVDPRPFAVGSMAQTLEKYSQIGSLVPAMGYSREQVADLQKTIERSDADVVLSATPIDLTRIVDIQLPTVRVRYELQEIGIPTLKDVLSEFLSG